MIKWGKGEGETLSIHVESIWCALGLTLTLSDINKYSSTIYAFNRLKIRERESYSV